MTMPALLHRRILVTRARGQASTLADLLAAEGADVISVPTIELAPPASWCGLDAALTALRSYDWLLFTSANAVHAFAERARQLKLSAHPKKIAVIGPATATAVRETGVAADVDLVPERYVAESLAEALTPHAPQASMLLVRAAVARDTLPESLAAAGALVTIAEAYRTVIPADSVQKLQELFVHNHASLDAITFTSASTAQNLAALLESAGLQIPAGTVLASIGPITSDAMRNLGMSPSVQPSRATIPALVEALAAHYKS
jgi:uroporphyrinogen-III synthase